MQTKSQATTDNARKSSQYRNRDGELDTSRQEAYMASKAQK